jgi:hypothetical protein
MERDPSQTLYTVALTRIRDESSQMKLAQTLSSVSGRLPMEAVMKRLDALPWTLTRKASYKRAYRLAKLLESLGGEVHCEPPLPKPSKPIMDETMILPTAELISQTQVMSTTQFITRPDEPPAGVAPVPAPKYTGTKHEAPEQHKPVPSQALEQGPAPEETVGDRDVRFFSRYKEVILVLLLSAVVMLGCAWLGFHLLERFGLNF